MCGVEEWSNPSIVECLGLEVIGGFIEINGMCLKKLGNPLSVLSLVCYFSVFTSEMIRKFISL